MKENKKNKCPLCGKEMDYIYGDMVCTECGYRKSYGASALEQAQQAMSENTQNAEKNEENKTILPPQDKPAYSYEQDHSSAKAQTGNRNRKKSAWKMAGIVLAVYFGLSLLINIASTVYFTFRHNSSYDTGDDSSRVNVSSEIADHKFPEYQGDISADTEDEEEIDLGLTGLLIEEIFNKKYTEVTPEELATVTELNIYTNSDIDVKTMEYTMENGTTGTVYFKDMSLDTENLRLFTGLRSLKTQYGMLREGDLDGLDQLTEIQVEMKPSDLAEAVNPEQITSLGIGDFFSSGSMQGIEQFTNLETLYADVRYLEDISELSSLKNLKHLVLENADSVKSFKVLYDMPQLESLYIESESLRDIGFVSGMENLTELSILDSEIKNIDALASCTDTLKVLNLSHNYQVSDYHIVEEMTQLSDLTLRVSYDFDVEMRIPDVSGIPDLTKLSVENYEYFDSLVNAQNLQELTVSDTYITDIPEITSLTNLRVLHLNSMSLDPKVIERIAEVSSLEIIDLNSSYVWGNVETMLNIPSLQELSLEYTTAGFDVDHLQTNEKLQKLNLNHARLKSLRDGVWNYEVDGGDPLILSNNDYIFTYYPNLKELYLEEQEIDDISFAESMKELRILDINDNYVTDLTPLVGLPALQMVLCEENPIADDAELGEKVIQD